MITDIRKEIILELKAVGLKLTDIKCLTIRYVKPYSYDMDLYESDGSDVVGVSKFEYNIPVMSTQEDIDAVYKAMSLTPYDNSYGTQELFGIIWINNGNWLERHEYDGSEWWEYKSPPVIPDFLQQENPYGKDYDIDSELPKLI